MQPTESVQKMVPSMALAQPHPGAQPLTTSWQKSDPDGQAAERHRPFTQEGLTLGQSASVRHLLAAMTRLTRGPPTNE
ncbi:MAG TPA: hypothetical protein VH482_28705 [Thermomicrobiales bacterium]